MVDAIRWEDRAALIIDQLALPGRTEWLRCVRSAEVADCIRTMKIRGAPAIGVAAAMGLALAVREPEAASEERLDEHFDAACREMGETRPTAVNLRWAIERMRAAYERARPSGLERVQQALEEEAESIAAYERQTCALMARHGADLVPAGARVLTHCNTGSLATVGCGTALGVVREAARLGRVRLVYVDETRPFLQGARLTAWELAQDGIPQRLIADSMAAFLMARGQVDFIVVGADRIAANGDVANKIGTYGLAVLAQYHDVPFYVAAPMSTVDRRIGTGADIPIEERAPGELTRLAGVQLAPEGVDVWNPAFDVTPNALVRGIITERGVLHPPYWKSISEALHEAAQADAAHPR